MSKKLKRSRIFESMVAYLQKQFAQLPDARVGQNKFISMGDIGLSAFSIFFNQCPSFLQHQRLMQSRSGANNARSLFGIEHIPTDNHIRDLLDFVAPEAVYPVFHEGLKQLEASGILESFRYFSGQLLLPVDGLHYFSSEKVHCDNCNTKHHKEGRVSYSHSMMSATLVHPEQREVIPLPPEFIEPQDGGEKEDCERVAIHRWLAKWGKYYARLGVTILGDDLYGCQPVCEAVLKEGCHFIFTCKESSHKCLYEWVTPLKEQGKLKEINHTIKIKAKPYRYRCFYVNQVPVRDGADAMQVNWCCVEVFDRSNKRVYSGAFITDHEMTDKNVAEIAHAGRTRWKTENEHNNTLKNHGYYLEHNYGHGKQHLASTLATLILLSFLFHNLLALLDERYQRLKGYYSRKFFFDQLRTITVFMYFVSWDILLENIYQASKFGSHHDTS